MAKKLSKAAKPRAQKLHHSFRRTYREDDQRPWQVPGLLNHAVKTFALIFKNWRLFLPLTILAVLANIVLVGLMSEETYAQFQSAIDTTTSQLEHLDVGAFGKAGLLLIATVTTGGLSQGMSEVEQIFTLIIFLILWFVTIYLVRHLLAGRKPKLRDALYNSLTPLLSSVALALIFFIQLIPIFLVVIIYSAALQTGFLDTPFYAATFLLAAFLLVLLSLYLVSATVVALIAVTAPGLYPMQALRDASDLLVGRRLKFILRLIFLIFVVALVYVIFMLPMILLDMWAKSTFDFLEGVPFVSFCLNFATAFVFIYASAYLYLFYRKMLENDQLEPKTKSPRKADDD